MQTSVFTRKTRNDALHERCWFWQQNEYFLCKMSFFISHVNTDVCPQCLSLSLCYTNLIRQDLIRTRACTLFITWYLNKSAGPLSFYIPFFNLKKQKAKHPQKYIRYTGPTLSAGGIWSQTYRNLQRIKLLVCRPKWPLNATRSRFHSHLGGPEWVLNLKSSGPESTD